MAISVRCPACDTKLKIQDPRAVGNKVRCPKCERPFTVKAPRRQPPPEDDYEDLDEFDDYEDSDYEEDWEEEPAPRRSRSRSAGTRSRGREESRSRGSRSRGQRSSSSRSRKPEPPGWQKPVLIGGGVLLGIGLIVALVLMFLPGDGGAGGGNTPAAQTPENLNQSRNNLKQIALGMHNFHETFNAFPLCPPSAIQPEHLKPDGTPNLSWRVYLLPFIDQGALFERFKLNEPWDSPHNRSLLKEMPALYRSPLKNTQPGFTCYLAPSGPGGIFEGQKGVRFRDIRDGMSNTVMVVEVDASAAVEWTKPADYSFTPNNPKQSLTGERFLVALCDGSTRVVSGQINPTTMLHLLQRNDGQPIAEF